MSSWNRIRVRYANTQYGRVVDDWNNVFRILTVKMDDGSEKKITMNNIGQDPNPDELHKWEWYEIHTDKPQWYRF